MANSTNVIHAAATLAKSTGKVFVRHPDGTQSVLKAGAQLNVGDVVVTSPGAHAEIQVAEGQLIKVGGAAGDALTIDKSILDTPADHHDVKADAATDFNKIIENLAKGDDIGDNLDPTAAGAAGAAGGDLMSGNVYVVVDPIVTTTTPSPFENVNSPSANTEPTMFSLLLAQANISLTASGIVDGIASDEDGVKYTASVDKISDVDLLIHLTVNGEPFDITIKAGTSSTDFSVLPKGEFVHGASETVVMLGATGGSYSSYSGSATSTFNFEDDHITVSIDPSKTSGVTSGIGSDEGGVTYTLSVDKGDQAPTDDVYVKVSVFDADAETNQTTYQFVKVVDGGTFTVATTEGQHGDHLTVT
ncbi:MAG: retention module-containing protein, partial [Methylophilales bacterium]|nr:retention module-containing protein [Methylophilales bacterium]